MKKLIGLFLFAAMITGFALLPADTDEARIDEPAPDFTLQTINGNEVSLSDFEGMPIVLEWVNFGCPFVKKHYDSGNMQMLQKKYTDKGVVWLTICSSAPGKQGHMSNDDIKEKLSEYEAKQTGYLVDAEGTVGKMYGAKTTPHMYVVDKKGILVYAGGIDDKPSTNQDDIEGAKNYVAMALDAVLEGNEVETKVSKPYGCSVKY